MFQCIYQNILIDTVLKSDRSVYSNSRNDLRLPIIRGYGACSLGEGAGSAPGRTASGLWLSRTLNHRISRAGMCIDTMVQTRS